MVAISFKDYETKKSLVIDVKAMDKNQQDNMYMYFWERCNEKFGGDLKSMSESVMRFKGVKLIERAEDTDPHLARKKRMLRKVLTQVVDGGWYPPGKILEVWYYTGNASIGYTLKKGRFQPRQGLLWIGASAYSTSVRLVADDLYDYYKPTWTVNARDRRVFGGIAHEFGHMFHEHFNLEKYTAFADLGLMKGVEQVEIDKAAEMDFSEMQLFYRFNRFNPWPSKEKVVEWWEGARKWGRYISWYASTHPNEFIAETFALLLAGAETSEAVMKTYNAFGGPIPPTAMRHKLTGKGWLKRHVFHPLMAPVFEMGAMPAKTSQETIKGMSVFKITHTMLGDE